MGVDVYRRHLSYKLGDREPALIDHPCPTCKAEPGSVCTGVAAKVRDCGHVSRQAFQATAQERWRDAQRPREPLIPTPASLVDAWLADATLSDPQASTRAADLYAAFQIARPELPVTATAFGRIVTARNPKRRDKHGVVYDGVALAGGKR